MARILVDADACPVKEEVFRVAGRCGLEVVLVANSWLKTPDAAWIRLVVVDRSGVLDEADDWIAERAGAEDIVVTDDVPLSARCLARGARVISTRGRQLDEESIGAALATRDLLQGLREAGEVTGGPAPFTKKDRSQFLQRLDQIVQALLRERP